MEPLSELTNHWEQKFDSLHNIINDLDQVKASKSIQIDVDSCHRYVSSSAGCLRVMAQNIRSIGCNMAEFTVLLERLKIECDVIILTECWLSTNPIIQHIEGFNYFTTTICHNQNDGVVIYVKCDLKATIEEPDFPEGNCLSIKIDNETNILAIYRPSAFDNTNTFINSLDSVLQNSSSYKNLIIMGDININIIENHKNDGQVCKYLNRTASYGLFPGHTFVTRDESKTCLDHVLLKTPNKALTVVIDSTITDHKTVLLCLHQKQHRLPIESTRNKINITKLTKEINNIDYKPIYEETEPNLSMNYLVESLQTAINKNTITIKIPNRKKIIKQWMTPGLLRCLKNRDRLYKKTKINPNNELAKITYQRYRKYCNNLLKKVKRTYERDQIKSAGKNSKKLWEAIKNITGTKKPKSVPHELLANSETPEDATNVVNSFFANVGKTLAEKIYKDPNDDSCTGSLSSTYLSTDSFTLLNTDEEEVNRLIMELKNECSAGWDKIPNRILKEHRYTLVPPLTYIFNKCLDVGIFPTALKKSVVLPIHKGGDRDRVNNYRPISILPSLSKILERIINNRLTKYLEHKNILSPNQYGFRAAMSTSDAVHELTNFVAEKLDKGSKCLSIFLDLAKAFDTVSVPILINKLESIGVRGIQLNLFKDYLTSRTQCVKIGETISTPLSVTYGVPQGSVLGPTLFLVYINDLCNLQLHQGKILAYADDTAILFSGNNWDDTFKNAQTGFNTVTKWLSRNMLTLNADKTKYLSFSIRDNTQPPLSKVLVAHTCCKATQCNCDQIERTDTIKYLGIFLDKHLNFYKHIEALCGRVRKLIYIFKNLRHVADKKTIKQVYRAFCESILTYCISSWGGAPEYSILRLERAQRAVLKVANFKPFLYPTTTLYEECQVLTVRQLFILNIIVKQHSLLNYLPENQILKRRKDLVCTTKRFKTSFIRKYFIFQGPHLYNKLNKTLCIFPLNKTNLKKTVAVWLQTKIYSDTEDLLNVVT